MKINVIITAGGGSVRFGEGDKLYMPLGATCVVLEATLPFLGIEGVSRVIIAAKDARALGDSMKRYGVSDGRIVVSPCGTTRTKTVKAALEYVEEDADYILIHDGARSFVTADLIRKVIDGASCGACVPLVPLIDSLVRTDGDITPCDRANFRGVQTPFSARRDWMIEAYKTENDFYDDVSALKTLDCVKINHIDGDPANRKITYACDLDGRDMLTGIGYDIHRLTDGDGLPLCGVKVPCDFAFVAHSDGDVPIHALMDAMLSAMGEKDIGWRFPTDDPAYDDIDSTELLENVLAETRDRGLCVHNAAIAIIAEKPRLAPYIDRMQLSLSRLLALSPDRIGVTVTTNEGVGELGACKAIAAYASVTLARK